MDGSASIETGKSTINNEGTPQLEGNSEPKPEQPADILDEALSTIESATKNSDPNVKAEVYQTAYSTAARLEELTQRQFELTNTNKFLYGRAEIKCDTVTEANAMRNLIQYIEFIEAQSKEGGVLEAATLKNNAFAVLALTGHTIQPYSKSNLEQLMEVVQNLKPQNINGTIAINSAEGDILLSGDKIKLHLEEKISNILAEAKTQERLSEEQTSVNPT